MERISPSWLLQGLGDDLKYISSWLTGAWRVTRDPNGPDGRLGYPRVKAIKTTADQCRLISLAKLPPQIKDTTFLYSCIQYMHVHICLSPYQLQSEQRSYTSPQTSPINTSRPAVILQFFQVFNSLLEEDVFSLSPNTGCDEMLITVIHKKRSQNY